MGAWHFSTVVSVVHYGNLHIFRWKPRCIPRISRYELFSESKPSLIIIIIVKPFHGEAVSVSAFEIYEKKTAIINCEDENCSLTG